LTVQTGAVSYTDYYNKLEVTCIFLRFPLAPFDSEEGEAASVRETTGESKIGSLLSRIRGNKEEAISASAGKVDIHKQTPKALDPSDDESKVVTARGTEDGLVLRIDGKSPWEAILGELNDFLGSRKRFLEGGEVSIEWLERLPTPEQSFELEQYLREGFGVEVVSRRRRPAFTTIVDRSAARSQSKAKSQVAGTEGSSKVAGLTPAAWQSQEVVSSASNIPSSISVGEELPVQPNNSFPGNSFPGNALSDSAIDEGLSQLQAGQLQGVDHYDSLGDDEPPVKKVSRKSSMERVLKDTIEILEDPAGPSYLRRVSKLLGEDLVYEEDANAKVVFGHFRSGQRLETPYSLVVIGDVNPGADLIAGGDIFVLGSLRGTAHAAAYDDEALDRVVVALSMQPVQLRIGSILSRGNGAAGKGPEVARIENRRIIVEGFNSRVNLRKKGI